MMRTLSRTRLLLAGALMCVAILYLPNISAGFTNWDDQIHVTENKRVQTFTWDSVRELFRPNTDYMYHPITMLTYAVEWRIGGGAPWVFHTTNLLLHLLNMLLVFRLIRGLSGDATTALIVTVLFGIHPLNTETVSWISARKDLLYAFFFLGGSVLYLFFLDGHRRGLSYTGICILFILGLLSKPTMVVFPFMLVLIDWWKGRPFGLKSIAEKVPLLLIAAGVGIFTMLLSASDTHNTVTIISLYAAKYQVLMVAYAAVFYLGKILMPVGLSAIHHYPLLSSGMLPLWYYAAPLVIALLVGLCLLFGRRWRFLLLGLGIYILPLLLVLQILPFNNTSLVAERYAYISTVGILFLVVTGVRAMLSSPSFRAPFWQGVGSMLLVLVTVMLAVGTVIRVSVWKDSISVFTAVIEQDQSVWIAYANRAIDRIKIGQYDQAFPDANAAIALHPNRKALYAIRGNIHFFKKRYAEAVSDFDSVTFSEKAKPYDYFNKGASLYYLGAYDSALFYYQCAFTADTSFARAYLGYGMIMLNERKQPAASVRYFDAALRYDPAMWEAYFYRADAARTDRRAGDAIADAAKALALNPKIAKDSLLIHVNALITEVSGRIQTLRDRIDAEGETSGTVQQLSEAYAIIGDTIRSRQCAERARVLSEGRRP